MKRGPRILFACGGTGGHVYPAIAIADAVRRLVPEADIAFAGTRERMEWEAVPKAGYPIHPITVSGLPRTVSPTLATFPVKLIQGLEDSLTLVRGFDPDLFAALVDPEDADVTRVMVTAGIDATRDLDLKRANVSLPVDVGTPILRWNGVT